MAALSTREQILTRMKAAGSKSPPPPLSAEETKALISSGQFRAEEAQPTPGEDAVWLRPQIGVDSPKEMPLSMSPLDRNFWFNLVIGCSGPDSVSTTVTSSRAFRSRNAAKLAYTTADVRRLCEFVKNPFSGPELVFPLGFRPFAGTFAEIVYLDDPRSTDLDGALAAMRDFFERNEKDPEWDGGQVNFFFAGHGANTPTARPTERGGLHLKDKVIGPRDLQDRLMSALPKSVLEKWYGPDDPGNCRVDMYLDCCYSGQFAAAFIGNLNYDCKGLVAGRFWCSSMPFQVSFESDELRQGIFSSYYLNDYSTKPPLPFFRRSLAKMIPSLGKFPSLKSGDVGKKTETKQNPFVMDFSKPNPLTIPGAVETTAILRDVPITKDVLNGGDAFAQWLTDYLETVHKKNWQFSK